MAKNATRTVSITGKPFDSPVPDIAITHQANDALIPATLERVFSGAH